MARHAPRPLTEEERSTLEIVDENGSGPLPRFPQISSWEPPHAGGGPEEYSWPDDDPPLSDR
jgi:hypothetical protein